MPYVLATDCFEYLGLIAKYDLMAQELVLATRDGEVAVVQGYE